jgi:single-stranded-DNA-specific exonuclease
MVLRARGEPAEGAVLLERGETPFGDEPPLPAGSVAVLDWGVRQLARPGILVDHHVPEAVPRDDQLVVSAHGERPEVSTAPLVRRLLPDAPAWLAAVGAFGDLGAAGLALPECAGAPRGAVRRLVPLVNAPRRIRGGPVREALAVLVASESAQAALADPRVRALEQARRAWQHELERVGRTAPRIAGDVVVIRFSSPAQVHPLVAARWQRRLAPRVVLVANDGYLPGRVNFSVRGGSRDLRALLREALPEGEGEFAHGHEAATGGSLPPDQFELLVARLGAAGG